MNKFVNAENVKDLLNGLDSLPLENEVEDMVNSLIVADVAAVKHGEWIESEYRRHGMLVDFSGTPVPQYFCSLCQRDAYSCEPYCHCGAKMDGE